MKDGIYFVVFRSNQRDFGNGTVVVKNNAVNKLVIIPILNVTAKPLIGPVPIFIRIIKSVFRF